MKLVNFSFFLGTLSLIAGSQAQLQHKQQHYSSELGVVSNIFEQTLEEYHIQAPDVLYRISKEPQLQRHVDGSSFLRGEAEIAPELLESIKKRVGVINLSPAFFYRRPDDPDQEHGAAGAGVTNIGALTDTRILTRTSPVHFDLYPSGEVVNGDEDVAFVMLNSNTDAYFQHGETSVPIVEGSLVYFNGGTPHNTVVNSGRVHILGPFVINASWMPGNSASNTVGMGQNGNYCETNSNCFSGICQQTVCVATASGGGDPHYTLQFNQHITVQSLCDLLLMDSPEAADGMGVTIHARHATPKKMMLGKEYTFISNIALRIGDTVWEVVADGAKIFKDGIEFDMEQSFAPGSHPFTVKKNIKGSRGNQVEYEFLFTDHSKIVFRANKHFKMAYIEVTGFSDYPVTGFLGRTDQKGFFNREGQIIADAESIEDSGVAVEMYAQEWQVKEDEPKLFMEKDVFPQAPNLCVFVDQESKKNQDLRKESHQDVLRGSRRKLSEVDSKLEAAANEACEHLADTNPKKRWCIDDVMSTGEVDIASDSFYA